MIWILRYINNYLDLNKNAYFADMEYRFITLGYCLSEMDRDDLLLKCDFDAKLRMCDRTNFSTVDKKNFSLNTDLDLTLNSSYTFFLFI